MSADPNDVPCPLVGCGGTMANHKPGCAEYSDPAVSRLGMLDVGRQVADLEKAFASAKDQRFPRFVDTREGYNLREVRPHLWVCGVRAAYQLAPPEGRWAASVNLSFHQDGPPRGSDGPHLGWYFGDGDQFPVGCLQAILEVVRGRLLLEEPVLIHCTAGLSRSPSAAYAVLRVLDRLDHREAVRRIRCPELDPNRNFPMVDTFGSAKKWVER